MSSRLFDDTVKALLRELESLKAELRRRHVLETQRPAWSKCISSRPPVLTTQPQPEGTGPQNLGDVDRRSLLETHYSRLLR